MAIADTGLDSLLDLQWVMDALCKFPVCWKYACKASGLLQSAPLAQWHSCNYTADLAPFCICKPHVQSPTGLSREQFPLLPLRPESGHLDLKKNISANLLYNITRLSKTGMPEWIYPCSFNCPILAFQFRSPLQQNVILKFRLRFPWVAPQKGYAQGLLS